MLQRKQSLFMLLSMAAVMVSFFFPFGTLTDAAGELALRSYGVKDAQGAYLDTVSTYWFHIPLTLALLMTGYAIMSFTDRQRQILVLRFSFLVFALSFILISFYISDAQRVYAASTFRFGVASMMPFVALILNWMAARAVRADEQLVRSVDRIR